MIVRNLALHIWEYRQADVWLRSAAYLNCMSFAVNNITKPNLASEAKTLEGLLMNSMEHQKGFTPVGIRTDVKETGPLYHGTKANLKIGDFLGAGFDSNYGERKKANFVYLTATMDAAIWGAELAVGEGKGRIYIVEPTGPINDDPNLTDMRFPGNPTRSYRTKAPLRIVSEVLDWEGHPPEMLQNMRDGIEELRRQGYEAINE